MDVWPALGMLLASAGSVAFHLSVRHQRWLAHPLPARPARLVGAVLLAAALTAFAQTLLGVVAVFVCATWMMLVCLALPHLDALRTILRGTHHD